MRASIAVAVLAFAASVIATADEQASPFLGKWNMTGVAPDVNNVYWLEVTQEGDQLKGMFLNRSGNPVPVTVKVENSELVFKSCSRLAGVDRRHRVDRSIAPASKAASWLARTQPAAAS